MSSDTVIQLLGVSGVSAIVLSIVNFILNRRRLGADVVKILTETSASQLTRMQDRMDRMDRREEEREAEDIMLRRALAAHEEWDRKVLAALRSIDPPLAIEAPPTLYPHYPKLDERNNS